MDDEIIQLGIREAKKSPHRLFKHGAVVIKNGEVISTAYNHDQYHAEALALFKIPRHERNGSTVLSVRVTKNIHKITMGEPCKSCMSIMKRMKVRNVFYTVHSGKIESKQVS